MAEPNRPDEELVEELLSVLREDAPDASEDLADKTMRKVRATLTARDLIDLSTIVFVLRFCAPMLDLFASFFPKPLDDRSSNDE